MWIPEPGDPDAIHDNVAGEIAALTEKETPVDADLILIEDSEDSNSKKKVQVGNLPGGGGGGGGENASYAETIGDNSNTSFQVTHDLGTQDLVVQLWDVTGAEPVEATGDASQIEIDDDDNITVTFSMAPAEDAYRVVILASGGSGGGGGGGTAIYRHAVAPDPGDPFDEEFGSDPTGSWTWLNQSTAAVTVDTAAEVLTLYDDRNANDVSMLGKAPPSGAWTVETLVYPWLAARGAQRSGGFLAVRYGSTVNVCGFYQLNDLRTLTFESNGTGTATAQSATPLTSTQQLGPAFLRVSWDESDLTWQASFTGADQTWFTIHSFTPGSTPDLVGFAGLWNRGHHIAYSFEYLRRVA